MNTKKSSHHQERHVQVRGVRRTPTDLKRLAGVIIAFAQAQAEAEAEDEAKKLQQLNDKAAPTGDAA